MSAEAALGRRHDRSSIHPTSHGHFGVKFMITASWVPPLVAVRDPRSKPVAWPGAAPEPGPPHIRSLRGAAAPTSRSHGHFGVKFMITASWVPPLVAVRDPRSK